MVLFVFTNEYWGENHPWIVCSFRTTMIQYDLINPDRICEMKKMPALLYSANLHQHKKCMWYKIVGIEKNAHFLKKKGLKNNCLIL